MGGVQRERRVGVEGGKDIRREKERHQEERERRGTKQGIEEKGRQRNGGDEIGKSKKG